MNKEKFQNIIKMLRELDTYKNSGETIHEVLEYIANELENLIQEEGR